MTKPLPVVTTVTGPGFPLGRTRRRPPSQPGTARAVAGSRSFS